MENKDYYKEFPDDPKGTIRYWKMKATKVINKKPNTVDNTSIKGKEKDLKPLIPPQTTNPPSQPIIDDPDELLMSVAIRMLNKPDPDPRWASILINCRKENITNKKEVSESFRQLSTETLVSLLKVNSQEEPS